jgi:hypothetical protein
MSDASQARLSRGPLVALVVGSMLGAKFSPTPAAPCWLHWRPVA